MRTIQELVESLQNGSAIEQQNAARDLEALADPKAVAALQAAASNGNVVSSLAAIDALAAIGEPAIDALAPLLSNQGIREGSQGTNRIFSAAVCALASIDDPRATEHLLRAIPSKSYEFCRNERLQFIAPVGSQRAIKCVIEAVEDRHYMVRRFVATTLGHIGDQLGVAPLERLTRDQDSDVRSAASKALASLLKGAVDEEPCKETSIDELLQQLDSASLHFVEAASILRNDKSRSLASHPDLAFAVLLRWASEKDGHVAEYAVPILERLVQEHAARLSTEQLERLARFEASSTWEYGLPTTSLDDLTTVTESYEIDSSRIRYAARRELERRSK